MNFLKNIYKRPVTIFFLTMISIAIGIISTSKMPINLLPDIAFPYLSVQTIYTGANAETIDKEVTKPLENALSQVTGLHNISTYSLDNASVILLQFEYGTDNTKNEANVDGKLREITLPDGCDTPKISSIDLNATSMYSLTVYSDTASMEEVYIEAINLKNKLSSIEGVGSVKLSGAPTVNLKIETINGLEMFAGLLVQDLVANSMLDIPLGEIQNDDGKIIIINHSKAETIEDIKKTSIGLKLNYTQINFFKGIQETISAIEDMSSEDLSKLKEDADNINEFIDKLNSLSDEELDDLVNNLQVIKALVETIENNSAAGLKLMWSQVLKQIFEDETFINLTDDELHEMANTYNISYGLLKWAHDNSDIDPDSGKSLAEIKWNKIVEFRQNHPDEVLEEDYPSLFYDIELVSSDTSDEDYMSEEDIIDAVKLGKSINTVALQNVVNHLKEDEEPTNAEYANMFIFDGEEYSIPLTSTTIGIIRDPNFDANYLIFYNYKINHEHIEDSVDEEGIVVSKIVGDYIPSKDFVELYNSMVFEEKFELEPTERFIDFIRDVDFTNDQIKIVAEQMADVYLDTKYESIAYYNFNQAIQLDIFGDAGSNATAIADEAKKIISTYDGNINFKVTSLNNQADFINNSLSNALVSLLIGSILAVAVIYLFLRKVKSSFIIALSMPLSVLLTLACLHLMDITLNMVSVGGIAVGIGMLVDNSIVVLESITSEKEKGKSVLKASVDGVKLVLGSLIGSTITSICVFFPILLINGLTKEIFADLSWAVIFSLSFSLLVAVTVIPTLFCFFFRKNNEGEKKEDSEGPLFKKLRDKYLRFLNVCLVHKKTTIVSLMITFVLSVLLVFTCSIEFLPSIDQHKIQVNVGFEAGTSIEICKDKTMKAYDLLLNNLSDVKYMSQSVGYSGLIEISPSGVIMVQLEDDAKKSKLVVEDIRTLLENSNIDADFSVVEQDGVVASLTGGISGVSVSIYGEDVDKLKEIASKIEDDVSTKKGIKHAYDNMLSKSLAYEIVFDQDKLVEHDIDYQTIVQTLRIGLAGYEIYEIKESDNSTDVIVSWKEDTIGDYYESLNKFIVGFNDDEESSVVHLEDVANIIESYGRHVIRKTNGLNVLEIKIEYFGIDTNTASNYLKKSAKTILQEYEGYSFASGGISSYLTDAFTGLIMALVISFFLLFGVMACLFESMKKPIIIIFSFPFAFAGGFLALAISRVSLNVVSFIGLIMLMGVIINDAIVLNERFDQLREDGLESSEAVIEGCSQRLRAVLMTTLTTVLALIPMALGLGKGGALMQPLGIVAIGGMTIGTIVTLVLIPCVYSVMYKIKYTK